MYPLLLIAAVSIAVNACDQKSVRPAPASKTEIKKDNAKESYALTKTAEVAKVIDTMAVISSPVNERFKGGLGLVSEGKAEISSDEQNPFAATGELFSEMGVGKVEASSSKESFSIYFESKSGNSKVRPGNHIYIRAVGDIPGGKITEDSFLDLSFVIVDSNGVEERFDFYKYYGHAQATGTSRHGQIDFNSIDKFFTAAANIGMNTSKMRLFGTLDIKRDQKNLTILGSQIGWESANIQVVASTVNMKMDSDGLAVKMFELAGDATRISDGQALSKVAIKATDIGTKAQQLDVNVTAKNK